MRELITRYLREKAGGFGDYRRQSESNGDSRIRLFNWWPEDDGHRYWFRDFIVCRGLLNDNRKRVDICSIFGSRRVLGWCDADLRIFFSGENLHADRFAHYSDYMLSGSHPFDLALGFDDFENDRYLRFPLWITYMFPPDATPSQIAEICELLRHPSNNSGDKFCSMIARWDLSGNRTRIFNALSEIDGIDCPSTLFHNDDSLIEKFGDDKCAYLNQYKFNICPENTNAWGYTTEKLFECIKSGCIPVYWGGKGNPEPDVVNSDAVLFWDDSGSNEAMLEKIKDLYANERLFKEFASLPRLTDNAQDWIAERFEMLEKKIRLCL
ncbi:MAG: glycosyltransferase family 10 [Bacteroidales bacterium]|nr:glycosyltransferase family 10 [Bacteroidales bacterium]